MFIKYQQIVMQFIVILLLFLAEKLLKRILHRRPRRWHCWWGWTIVFWIMITKNLGIYWVAYPIALWMVWALLLIILQTVHNHEFIYRRYWPVFWRLSTYYAVLIFILSLISAKLPLV